MTQQQFADRLGKSKSWVDKVERGIRRLEKISTIAAIAEALRIDAAVLMGRDIESAGTPTRADAPTPGGTVDRIRVALSTYEVALGGPAVRPSALPPARVAGSVEHAWSAYERALYRQLTALLPDVLTSAQRIQAQCPDAGRAQLVDAYRVTAALLVKLGDPDLAWLAADRAIAVATGHPVLVSAAAVQVGQALRAAGRARSAMTTMLAAAYRIAPPDLDGGAPEDLSLCGSLIVQAALAAARLGDDRAVVELTDDAADMAARVGDGRNHHHTGFGPTAVDLARLAAAVELGEGSSAVAWYETASARDGWRWLPPGERAGHLIEVARAYLQIDAPARAGRAVVDAERLAPAEVRDRPAARDVLARVVRCRDAPDAAVRLAVSLGVG